jgi:hypothetical protein
MGDAVWLFDWCLWRQTRNTGWVLGGSVVTYAKIQRDTGFAERTLQRWMHILKSEGYIEVSYSSYKRMRIRVANPKKLGFIQKGLFPPEVADKKQINSARSGGTFPPEVADTTTKSGGFNKNRIRADRIRADNPSAVALQGLNNQKGVASTKRGKGKSSVGVQKQEEPNPYPELRGPEYD